MHNIRRAHTSVVCVGYAYKKYVQQRCTVVHALSSCLTCTDSACIAVSSSKYSNMHCTAEYTSGCVVRVCNMHHDYQHMSIRVYNKDTVLCNMLLLITILK
jgi:hypothetical protein